MAAIPTFKQQCPSCEAMVTVKENMVGKKVECHKCKDQFIAEMPEEVDELEAVDELEEVDQLDEIDELEEVEEGSKKKAKAAAGSSKVGAATKKSKLALADDDDDDDGAVQVKPSKSKTGTNGKSNGKPRKADLDDEEDEDDEAPSKKKSEGGSSKLTIGLALAVVGVVILCTAAFFVMRSRNQANIEIARKGQGQNQDNNDNVVKPPVVIPEFKAEPTAVALNDAELAKLSNLLPGDSEHVFHLFLKDLLPANSPLRSAAFETPGALDDAGLAKKLGFSLLGIDDFIRAEKYTFPNWKYTVIHFKDVIKEEDLKVALKLKSAGAPIEGQAYYKSSEPNPWFDTLARFSLAVPNHQRYFEAQGSDRPTFYRIHNPQTLIVGDEVPVLAFLKAKGQFPLQSSKNAAPPPPTTNTPPTPSTDPMPNPAGMTGGTPAPPPPRKNKPGGGAMLPPSSTLPRAEFVPVAFFNDQKITGGGDAGSLGGNTPTPGVGEKPPNLDGTEWEGTEDGANKVRFAFKAGGMVAVSGVKLTAAGTWQLTGNNVIMSFPDKQITYQGTVNATTMSGDATEGGQKKWTWSATRSDATSPGTSPGTAPTPAGVTRDDMYLTIKPSLKTILDRMESRGPDGKDKVLFSSATDMDASRIDTTSPEFKDIVVRRPRQFWDVTLMLQEGKPRIRHLGTALTQRDTLKYQLRNELSCGQEIDAKEFQRDMKERTAQQVARFAQKLVHHDIRLPMTAEVKKVEKDPTQPAPPPPPGTQPETKQPEEKKTQDVTSSQIVINQQGSTVEFVLDLVLDNPTLTQLHAITALTASSLRVEMEAIAMASLRHTLASGGRTLGEKGMSDREVAPGRFPPGAFKRAEAPLRTDKEPKNRISWMAGLLPYMGHQNLFNRIRFDQSWREPGNWMAGNTLVPQFLDPSYPDFVRYVGIGELPIDYAATHYVGIAGVGLDAASFKRSDPATVHKRGVLGYDESASLDEVRQGRGTSNTILMIQVPHDGLTGVSPWIAGGGATLRGVPEKNSIAPFVLSKDRNGFITHQNKRGTFALMTDGSVRFIDQNISDEVFKAMCTVNGPAPQEFDLSKNPQTPLIPAPEEKGVKKPPVKPEAEKKLATTDGPDTPKKTEPEKKPADAGNPLKPADPPAKKPATDTKPAETKKSEPENPLKEAPPPPPPAKGEQKKASLPVPLPPAVEPVVMARCPDARRSPTTHDRL